MNVMGKGILFSLVAGSLSASAQLQVDWKEAGQLKTRHAKEIQASTWSIGGEVLDRDFTDYHAYKSYLGPLGAKRIRLQGGWAKCEKVKGQYDFKWLDDIVNDAFSQGVNPWIELSYGNPVYGEAGGQAKLAGKLPTGEALIAWDNWVREMVTRYKNKVTEWEVWNEPDIERHLSGITGESFAHFYIRTAEIVRTLHPKARLLAIGLAGISRTDFIQPFLETLKAENKLSLVDVITYHGYIKNPDDSYPIIEKLCKLVWSYNPKIVMMQGENGAPSGKTIGALGQYEWTELTQCKWDLRRMLGDHGRGIETNLFTISDMAYKSHDHRHGINTKGLLKIRSMEDMSIERPKMMYRAAQHVFSLFDNQVRLSPSTNIQSSWLNQSVFAYQQVKSGKTLLTLWQHEEGPAEKYAPKSTTITIENARFEQPVLVDLISGKIYEIPKAQWTKSGSKYTFTGIPVPDYPVVISDITNL